MKHRHGHAPRANNNRAKPFADLGPLAPVTQSSVEAFATMLNGMAKRNAGKAEIADAIKRQETAFGARGFDSPRTKELFDLVVAKHAPKAPEKPETEPVPASSRAPAFDTDTRGGAIHALVAIGLSAAIVACGAFALVRINDSINRQMAESREIARRVPRTVPTADIRTYITSVPERMHYITNAPASPKKKAPVQKPDEPILEIRALH